MKQCMTDEFIQTKRCEQNGKNSRKIYIGCERRCTRWGKVVNSMHKLRKLMKVAKSKQK